MSGLDKIADTIIKEAQVKADEILAKAQEEVKAIEKTAANKVAEVKQKYLESVKREVEGVNGRFASDNRQKRSQALLKTRRMVIEDTLSKTKQKLENLPDNEYFDFLKNICVKNAQSGDGQLYFATKDYARLPKDFADKCNKEIKNGSVKLAGETKDIKNGFIIIYGKIEQNCSIDSIFDSNKNLLEDAVKNSIGE